MNRILPLIGFFLPMLVTVMADHLIKQPIAAEAIDAIITTIFFTAVFAIGIRLGEGHDAASQGWKGLLHGLAAGIVVQAVIWGFWLAVAEAVRYSFGFWPLLGHILLIMGAGYMMSRLQPGDMGSA